MGPSQHELFLLTCCHYDLITPTRTNTTSVTYLYCHLGHEDGSEYVVGQLEENALLQTGRAEEARISKGLKLAPLFSGFLHVCRTVGLSPHPHVWIALAFLLQILSHSLH